MWQVLLREPRSFLSPDIGCLLQAGYFQVDTARECPPTPYSTGGSPGRLLGRPACGGPVVDRLCAHMAFGSPVDVEPSLAQ